MIHVLFRNDQMIVAKIHNHGCSNLKEVSFVAWHWPYTSCINHLKTVFAERVTEVPHLTICGSGWLYPLSLLEAERETLSYHPKCRYIEKKDMTVSEGNFGQMSVMLYQW